MLLLDQERQEIAKLQNKRRAEEERRKRIFDEKWRKIGVDIQALREQQMQKEADQRRKLAEEKTYAEQQFNSDRLAVQLQQQKEMQRREKARQLNEYRMQCQKRDASTEWDVTNPLKLKQEKPPREFDDQQIPVSSLQRFTGEDLKYKERLVNAREAMRCDLQRQMSEKQSNEQYEKQLRQSIEALAIETDKRAAQAERMLQQRRRERDLQIGQFNTQLSIAKQQQRDAMLRDNIRQEILQKDVAMNNDWITENPRAAIGSAGKVLVDRWKGMSMDDIHKIREQQQKQIKEHEDLKMIEQMDKLQYEKALLDTDKRAVLMERERANRRRAHSLQMGASNQQLATEIRRQRALQKVDLYDPNAVGERFFASFGTSSR